MKFELEFVDLKLDSSRPLEAFGALVGGAVGAYFSLKYKAVVAVPAVAGLTYSCFMNHKPGAEITKETIQAIGTDVMKGASGAMVLGAKAGSYLDDVSYAAYSFAVDNNVPEKASLWYNYTADCASQAKSSAYNLFIKAAAFTYIQIYGKPNPAPESMPEADPAPSPVNDDSISGRMIGMKEEIYGTYNQYQELYQDAWKWMFGADQVNDL